MFLFLKAQEQISYSTRAAEYLKAEKYEEASQMYSRAVEFSLKKGDYYSLFMLYNELGGCYKHLGEYSQARDNYRRSIDAAKQVGIPDVMSDKVRLNMAMLLSEMGLYDGAERVIDEISTLQNTMQKNLCLAEIFMRRGDSRKALQVYDNILASGPEIRSYIARQNRGYLLSQSRSVDTLLMACNDINYALKNLEMNTDSYYIALSNLAMTEAKLEDYESAELHIKEAEEWFKSRNQGTRRYPDYIIILRKKAEILMMQQRWKEAEKAYHDFFEVEKGYAIRNFSSMTEQNRLDFWKKEKPFLSRIFALENNCPEFLYDVAIFRRETAMLGRGAETMADSARLANKMKKRLQITCNDIRNKLHPDEVAIEFVRYCQIDGAECYGALIISSKASGKSVDFVPLWKENEINSFMVGDRRLLPAVCSPSKKNDKNQIYNSISLADFIWKPLYPFLVKAKDVYFAPEGLLHMLAIEYLTPSIKYGSDIKFHRLTSTANLIERNIAGKFDQKIFAVGGLNYDEEIVEESSSANHDAIDYLRQYNQGRGIFFRYLEGSKDEVIAIDSIALNVDMTFTQSEEQIKHTLSSKKYNNIHLATHGYALQVAAPRIPNVLQDSITEDKSLLGSGLALTGANVAYKHSTQEDGILSAREICEMDLSDISLLVISACQSAQGTISDEGPAGLVRGLKKAGVKSIIATLWEIDDDATKKFMKFFYESISNDGDKYKALINAQQAVKNYVLITPPRTGFDSARMKSVHYPEKKVNIYSDPYYWAGFILID